MRQLLDTLFTNAAVTTSAIVPSENLFAVSVMAVVAGTAPVGTLSIDASNDNIPNYPNAQPTHFVQIATVAISATGTVLLPKMDICYQYLRVTFTATSGTPAVTVTLKALGS